MRCRASQLDPRPAPAGTPVLAVGWGATTFPIPPGATPPRLLRQRDTTVRPATDCAGGFITAGELCAGPGTCFGDAPLLRRTPTGSTTVLGIASRETSAADPCGQPVVFTDLTDPQVRQWLLSTILSPAATVPPCTCAPAGPLDDAARTRMHTLQLQP